MKKILLGVALLVTGTLFNVSAQRVMHGDKQVNAGVGFSNGWKTPVFVGFDYGLNDDVTLGAQVAYASQSSDYKYYSDKLTWITFGVNANYHFNRILKVPNNWDLYGGVTIAYDSFNYTTSSKSNDPYYDNVVKNLSSPNNSAVGFAAQVGARYYFTNKFGVNLEYGGGSSISSGKVGVSFKF